MKKNYGSNQHNRKSYRKIRIISDYTGPISVDTAQNDFVCILNVESNM